MKVLCAVLLFIGVFTLNNAISMSTLRQIAANQMSTQQLMMSRANNPDYTLPCFILYTQENQNILAEFQSSYQKCQTDASAQNELLNAEAAGNQTLINAAAEDVCSSMSECSALDASLQILDCYSQVGDTNLKIIYTLTSNASVVAANLREQYRKVEFNMEACQNASEQAYVESTAATYDSLNYCLANGPPAVVTTTTAPETTSAEVDTTAAIEETTTEESAAEPIQVEDLSAPVVPKRVKVNKHKVVSKRHRN